MEPNSKLSNVAFARIVGDLGVSQAYPFGNGKRVYLGGIEVFMQRPVERSANRLHANHPNPFNPTTTIGYELPEDGPVLLVICDVAGRRIRTLVQSSRESAGIHSVAWDGRDDAGRSVTSGMYFYRLHADLFEQTRKMILVK